MSALHGDKQEAILDAAYDIFGTKGFYETKISEIAEQAGIAKGTVYLYFESKEQLFQAVTRRDCEQFLERLSHSVQGCAFEEQMHRMAGLHLRYHYERRHHSKLFFMLPNNDPELMEYMRDFIQRYTESVIQVLEQARVNNATLHAKAFIGMLERLKMDFIFNQEYEETELLTTVELAAKLFLRGCRAVPIR